MLHCSSVYSKISRVTHIHCVLHLGCTVKGVLYLHLTICGEDACELHRHPNCALPSLGDKLWKSPILMLGFIISLVPYINLSSPKTTLLGTGHRYLDIFKKWEWTFPWTSGKIH